MTDYFTELVARLRERGVPATQATDMITELADHVTQAGVDPSVEFGPAGTFAEELTTARGDGTGSAGPDAAAESWRWNADAFTEMRLLTEFGDQGWEVDRIDRIGRFVSRRDRQSPQRWTYHREIVTGKGSAVAVLRVLQTARCGEPRTRSRVGRPAGPAATQHLHREAVSGVRGLLPGVPYRVGDRLRLPAEPGPRWWVLGRLPARSTGRGSAHRRIRPGHAGRQRAARPPQADGRNGVLAHDRTRRRSGALDRRSLTGIIVLLE